MGGDDAVDGFLGEVFHGQNFCAGEARFAQRSFAEFQHFLRSGRTSVSAECLDTAEDGGCGFAGDGLVGDGFEEGFVGTLQGVGVHLEGPGGSDQLG